jgi:type VI secretion system secreted protein VgrG
VHGPQTAVVVGPDGEEIYTDPDGLGRIRVHFHWDREPAGDESSCWVRVAQSWAGKQWGAWYLPRVGQEVVVEFLEGDPDRPLVTGSVYNADLLPPFELPANKTWSGVRTRSSKEAGAANCNEIRFEDKKGSEELFLHAEKDELHEVENDLTITVGNDRTLTVEGNKTETVEKSKTVTVKEDHGETISGSMTLSVEKERTMLVSKDLTENVDGKMSLTVAKDRDTTVQGGLNVKVSKDVNETIEGNATRDVTKKSVLKAKEVTVEADDKITLKTGKAKIEMKKNGDITISGAKITVKGSGDVIIKGSKVTLN